MNKQSATEILKKHMQRITEKRVVLLQFLMKHSKAYTLSEIEKNLSITMDRVTVYRTLQTFEIAGLITKLVDQRGVCMYMFNFEKHEGLSMHPHLHCSDCDEIVCLPCLPIEYLEKLKNYEIDDMYFLLNGKCKSCSNNDEN
ncbi:hypothetical protein GCM10011506_45310 [Marivirga lumbricoides]|uniref:Transcriptional repressor n=1 Tax=Marivirga lumbricoides TaxID=1046115 RepID=A0ABQ1N8Y1_9BACT|nr:hypothetical protein GCM10011506_45310 [Marivirga lumbricoides]